MALPCTKKATEPTFHFLLHWSCSCAASARCLLAGSGPLPVASALLTFFVVSLFLPAGNLSFPVAWKAERRKNVTQITKGVHLDVFSIYSHQIWAMNFKSVLLVRFVTKYFCIEKRDVPNMMNRSFKGIFTYNGILFLAHRNLSVSERFNSCRGHPKELLIPWKPGINGKSLTFHTHFPRSLFPVKTIPEVWHCLRKYPYTSKVQLNYPKFSGI